MYYVIFVGAGNEAKTEQLIRRAVAEELCSEYFHPVRHMKKKIRGEWRHVYEKILPGYVFVESGDIAALHKALIRTPGFKKILRTEAEDGSFDFYALTQSEVNWLMSVCGRLGETEKILPVIELTQVGFDENDKVRVLSGPLKGREAMVKKIDLHRRTAEIEVDFMGRPVVLRVGIEIIKKEGPQSGDPEVSG